MKIINGRFGILSIK